MEMQVLQRLFAYVFVFVALVTNVAFAQTATITAGSSGTVNYNYALALAKAANEISGLDLRPKPFMSPGQGAASVDRGEVDFGVHNAIILREAYLGLEFYEGRALTNLRAVARMIPFQTTLAVPGKSEIRTIEDMKGVRFPAGFDATAFGDRLYEAILGTAGLSFDDVNVIHVNDWAGLGKAFVGGEIDVGGLAVGAPTSTRYAELVEGYRGISIRNDPEVEAKLQEIFPSSRLAVVEPAEGLAGVLEPLTVLEYDYWVFAHKDVPDETVTAFLTAMSQGKDILLSASKDFRNFDPELMYQDIGVPFHPAAEAFYAGR
jgi:hypothetical protein